MLKSVLLLIAGVVAGLAIATIALFSFASSHNLTARGQASGLEAFFAQRALGVSVPASAKDKKNPLAHTSENAATGQSRFMQKCAICHALDGSGRTEIGSGEYPHPPDLRSAQVQNMSDGELFYIIQNGVRYSGMPAWALPDDDTWRLVTFVRQLPKQ